MLACQKGHCETVRVLLFYKAKVEVCDLRGRTALMLAISWGHVRVVSFILAIFWVVLFF